MCPCQKTTQADVDACCQAGPVKRVRSEVLLEGRGCLIIEHDQAEYVLRHTRKGRLILTKI